MRIVGGEFRSRALVVPAGDATRPTSDRVREALFNILEHGPYPLAGARVIDLFAGSGALGLEALSRGAAYALFVEDRAAARGALRTNIEALGLNGRTRIFRRDATSLGAITAGIEPFDLAFLDPPYDRGLAPLALTALLAGGWLRSGARLVIETRSSEELALPEGFTTIDRRAYGDTAVTFAALDLNSGSHA